MQKGIPCQPERSERSFWDEAAITASTAVASRLFGDYELMSTILNKEKNVRNEALIFGLPGVIGVQIADTLLAARRTREDAAVVDECPEPPAEA